jgi:hypothetical protein
MLLPHLNMEITGTRSVNSLTGKTGLFLAAVLAQ